MAPPALPGFNATTSLSATDATGPDPHGLPVAIAAAVVVGFPCFICIPSIHAVALYPGGIAECVCRLSSSATLAFPACPIGRLPRQAFRGLVERLLALRPASSRDHQVILSIDGSDGFVASSAASIATGQATLPRRDFHPLEYTRIHGARTGMIELSAFGKRMPSISRDFSFHIRSDKAFSSALRQCNEGMRPESAGDEQQKGGQGGRRKGGHLGSRIGPVAGPWTLSAGFKSILPATGSISRNLASLSVPGWSWIPVASAS